MKCLRCESEMEHGDIYYRHGSEYGSYYLPVFWRKKISMIEVEEDKKILGLKYRTISEVKQNWKRGELSAFRCKKCGYTEMQVKDVEETTRMTSRDQFLLKNLVVLMFGVAELDDYEPQEGKIPQALGHFGAWGFSFAYPHVETNFRQIGGKPEYYVKV